MRAIDAQGAAEKWWDFKGVRTAAPGSGKIVKSGTARGCVRPRGEPSETIELDAAAVLQGPYLLQASIGSV